MTLLLLAGAGEARGIAAGLAARGPDFAVWVPEGARVAQDWPAPCHHGPLTACLAALRPTAVLDASHPFASGTSHAAARHSAQIGAPYCLLRRPEWRAEAADRWTHVASEAEAVRHIAPGSIVMVASGREGLASLSELHQCYVYCRQIGAPDVPFPLPQGEWLVQQPPFSVEDETALFQRLGVDWLILRNAGSLRAETKLTAARALGVQVAMMARPAPPDAPIVTSETGALAWAAGR